MLILFPREAAGRVAQKRVLQQQQQQQHRERGTFPLGLVSLPALPCHIFRPNPWNSLQLPPCLISVLSPCLLRRETKDAQGSLQIRAEWS